MDNRNTQLGFNFFAGFYQMLCLAGNFVIYLLCCHIDITGNTIEQRNTHSNGTDIQMLVLNHLDGF